MLTGVNTHEIISALDDEIARLQHARTLIAGLTTQKQIGRPLALASPKKRVISDEGRKRTHSENVGPHGKKNQPRPNKGIEEVEITRTGN
jgi:hypothetical protein